MICLLHPLSYAVMPGAMLKQLPMANAQRINPKPMPNQSSVSAPKTNDHPHTNADMTIGGIKRAWRFWMSTRFAEIVKIKP